MDKTVGKILGNIAGSLHLYQFCSKVGIEAIFYRMCYKNELRVSTLFYDRNKDRIKKNADMFTEEESKDTYLKAIDFRKTHRLRDRPQFCDEKEYFNSLTKLKRDEVLIDCGAYTGDTVEQFIAQSGNCYRKIVAFEPDSANFIKLDNSLREINNCFLVRAGVWTDNGKVSFREGDLAGSRIINKEDDRGGGRNRYNCD